VAHVVYIGDEVTAAGFRLAGIDARTVEPSSTADELRRAVTDGAELILLSGQLAGFVPPPELAAVLAAPQPPVVVVDDVCGKSVLPDLTREVRATLGIEA
jgi:vacuolar-type H+-ATPase subunit F/Vma7